MAFSPSISNMRLGIILTLPTVMGHSDEEHSGKNAILKIDRGAKSQLYASVPHFCTSIVIFSGCTHLYIGFD